MAHPWCYPPCPGPLPEACRSPVACGDRDGGQAAGAGRTEAAARLIPTPPLPNPAPALRAAGRWWAQERRETQCPHRALTQKPQGGEGPTSPPISTHSEPSPSPQACQPNKIPIPATHVGLALSRSHGRRQSPCASLCRARRARSICSRSCFHWA